MSILFGGLSRTTYPNLKSSVIDLSGPLTLAVLRQLYNNIADGGTTPTEIYTTKAVKASYESLMTPALRINRQYNTNGMNRADGAIPDLDWNGMPIWADRNCPTGTLYMVNSDYLAFYAVEPAMSESINLEPGNNADDAQYTGVKGFGFKWTGWKQPVDQYAQIGHLILQGELISQNPRRQGKIINIS